MVGCDQWDHSGSFHPFDPKAFLKASGRAAGKRSQQLIEAERLQQFRAAEAAAGIHERQSGGHTPHHGRRIQPLSTQAIEIKPPSRLESRCPFPSRQRGKCQ